MSDPVGYAQMLGLSDQDMALIGQAYLYHLVPEKAPPDLRYKMLEAKSSRERKTLEEQRQRDEYARAEDARQQQINQYVSMMGAAAEAWGADGDKHPYQASHAWFGGNHDEYSESLVHTARNIAAGAQERGEVADLSIKAVAATLERDLASRLGRAKPQAAAPTQPAVVAAPKAPTSGKQPAVMSTRGQDGGAPRPPAETDEERVKRAIAAVFGD
jgi:hypothetical protein